MSQRQPYLDFRWNNYKDQIAQPICALGDRLCPDAPDNIAFLHQACRNTLAHHNLDHAVVYPLGPVMGFEDSNDVLDMSNGFTPSSGNPGLRVRIKRGTTGLSSMHDAASGKGWAKSLSEMIATSPDLPAGTHDEFTLLGKIIALDTLKRIQHRASENLIPALRPEGTPVTRINSVLHVTAGDMIDAAMVSMQNMSLSPATTLHACGLLAEQIARHKGFEQAPDQPVANLHPARDLIASNPMAVFLSAQPYGQKPAENHLATGIFRIHDFDPVIGAKTATLSRILYHCHDRGMLDLWQPFCEAQPDAALPNLYARPLTIIPAFKAVLGELSDNAMNILSDGMHLTEPANGEQRLIKRQQRYHPGQKGPTPSPQQNRLEPPPFSP